MSRVALRWLVRIGVVVTVVTVVRRTLRAPSGLDPAGGLLPSIVGDTWPPVPANPDRPR